jgi:uncharacterized protein YqeY
MTEKDIQSALKESMKAGNTVAVSAIRMFMSELKYKKIEDLNKEELSEEKIAGVLGKMLKKYKDSIDQFKAGNRQDLVDKENAEMEVLVKFLPEQMPEEEVKKIVSESVAQSGAVSQKDMGKVMKIVLERVKGRADGSLISRLVKETLS